MINIPVQVIIAGKDRMAPSAATDELIKHLNEPDVTKIANSGHMVPQEVPNRCRALLRSFIFANNPAT